MLRRRLGRSDIEVGALGLGCMEIGGMMKDDEQYHLTESAQGKPPVFFLGAVDDEQSIRILSRDGRTLAQGALAWVWARSPRIIPIPGFRTLAQVEDNIKAVDFGPLAPEQMVEIDKLLGRTP
jgi:aryl-alcohol dehydrogenase-like predicted oxidoreductase